MPPAWAAPVPDHRSRTVPRSRPTLWRGTSTVPALAQARAAGAAAVDGHDCFVAGWACALAGVFGLDPEEALAAIRAAEPAPDHGAHPQDDAGHVLDGPTPASRS